MDRSTRNLSIITLTVLVIFLALNHIARRSALADWGDVLFFVLLTLAIWFYDRMSRRGVDDSEASETVIEPLVYDRDPAPMAIPDMIQVAAPVVVTPPPVVRNQPAPVSKAAAQPVAEVSPSAAEAKPASRGKGKAASAPTQADDLKVVEGIGPKMEKALNAAGISTYAQLAASTEEQINAAIVAAGMRFAPSAPTWAEQASYAAKGDLAGLEAFQKTLAGGRKTK